MPANAFDYDVVIGNFPFVKTLSAWIYLSNFCDCFADDTNPILPLSHSLSVDMQKRVMYSVAHKLLCISRSPPPLLACMSVCSLGVYPQKIKGRENSRIWLINSTHPWQGQNFHQLHVTLFFSITFTSQLISSPSAPSLQWCGAFSPLSDSLFQENHTHWLNRLDGNTNKLWMMFTVKRTSDEKGKKMVKRLHRIEWKDTTCVLHISPDECSKAEEFGTMRRLTELLRIRAKSFQ